MTQTIDKQKSLEANPWTRLSSRIVYSNPWISVREDQVLCPDASPGIYGVVETRIATGVIALTEQGEIYLVGQYRYPVDEYSWEIIEGGADKGEDPMQAARRELREEAGIEAASLEPLGGQIQLSNCYSAEVGYLYLARGLRHGPSAPDHTEILQLKKLPLGEAVAMVDAGQIKDGLSIIGILRLQRHLAAAGD
jgi:8-oxo-dGTP pyrophosphatase MutT (NUDIX family)